MSRSPKKSEPPPSLFRLPWWRATKYTITPDRMIAPAPGADVVPVDVWVPYLEAIKRATDKGHPHIALANLAPHVMWTVNPGKLKPAGSLSLGDGWSFDRGTRALFLDGPSIRKPITLRRSVLRERFPTLPDGSIPSDKRIMTDESDSPGLWQHAHVDEDAVLAWVSEHGLPGQLLHRYALVTATNGGSRTTWTRTINGWVELSDRLAPGPDTAVRFGKLGELEIVELDEWRWYLDPASDTGPWPPCPGSPEFFRASREPLADVVEVALMLNRIMATLLTAPGDLEPLSSDGRIGTLGQMKTIEWAKDRTMLDAMLSQGVQLTTAPSARGMHQQIRCYSLLGALAMMTISEVSRSGGAWLIRCAYCGQFALRRMQWTKFCSDEHRDAMNMLKFRAQRTRKKNEER